MGIEESGKLGTPDTAEVPMAQVVQTQVEVVEGQTPPPAGDEVAAAPENAASMADQNLAPSLADADQEAFIALKNLEEKRKKKRRVRLIKILVVLGVITLAIVGFAISCSMSAANLTKPTYSYGTAEVQDFKTTVQAAGTIQPVSSSVVTPETSGIIDQVLVSEGQWVEEGQTLFVLKNDDLDKTINDAWKKVTDADNALADAWNTRNDLENAYQKAVDDYNAALDLQSEQEAAAIEAADAARDEAYEKAIILIPKDATDEQREILLEEAEAKAEEAYAEVYSSMSVTVPAPVDDASYISQIDTANAAITTADSALSSAQDAYDDAVKQGDKRNVKAPHSGTVLSLTGVEGASVGGATGGSSQVSGSLATIADLSQIKVDIEVNEADISEVSVGEEAEITFTSLPDLELKGEVTNIASVASGSGESGGAPAAGVVTYKVEVMIEGKDEGLKPGMTANVFVVTQNVPNVIVVPAAAVTEMEGTATVDVVTGPTDVEEPTVETREVEVGAKSSSQVVITSGLEEGETIVTGVSTPLADITAGGTAVE